MTDSNSGAATALTILQITDSHLFADPANRLLGVNTEESFQAVLALAEALDTPVDVVLATGDLAQDGSGDAYRRMHGYLSRLDAPVYWIPGNHDNPQVMARELPGGLISDEHCFTRNGWRVILLDTTVRGQVAGRLEEAELDRLEECLANAPDLHTMVCLHHHPVPSGCAWMESIGVANADQLFAIVDRHPQVKVILWGHIHQDFRGERNGVELIASPSTCFQFQPNSAEFAVDEHPPGLRVLELGADGSVQTEVIRVPDFEITIEEGARGY